MEPHAENTVVFMCALDRERVSCRLWRRSFELECWLRPRGCGSVAADQQQRADDADGRERDERRCWRQWRPDASRGDQPYERDQPDDGAHAERERWCERG